MVSPAKKRQTGCPIAFGLDTFGDRWSLLIIRDLMLKHKKTYREFLDADEAIATNILADRLKHLETEGIIKKSRDPENRRSFLYSLTEKGCDLAPIILEIIQWSGKYDLRTFARRDVLKRIEKDRDAVIAEIRSGQADKDNQTIGSHRTKSPR